MTPRMRRSVGPVGFTPPGGPLRTCVGCRRALPQAALLRVARTPDGLLTPDPRRRVAGRGAYLCPREECLVEALRRGPWSHAFKAPTAVRADTRERLRVLIDCRRRSPGGSGDRREGGW